MLSLKGVIGTGSKYGGGDGEIFVNALLPRRQ